MQNKFRLYERYNGTFYAQEIEIGRRETLKTKDKATAELKLSAIRIVESEHMAGIAKRSLRWRKTEQSEASSQGVPQAGQIPLPPPNASEANLATFR